MREHEIRDAFGELTSDHTLRDVHVRLSREPDGNYRIEIDMDGLGLDAVARLAAFAQKHKLKSFLGGGWIVLVATPD